MVLCESTRTVARRVPKQVAMGQKVLGATLGSRPFWGALAHGYTRMLRKFKDFSDLVDFTQDSMVHTLCTNSPWNCPWTVVAWLTAPKQLLQHL